MAAKRGYRFSKNKKALPKYVKKMAKQANKRLDEWRKNGLTSNEERLASKMLEDFYKQAGKNIKDPQKANERIRLTREQQQEYIAILNYIKLEVDTPSERDYKNKEIRDKLQQKPGDMQRFETFKDKYDFINDEQDFVDAIDNINRVKQDAILNEILYMDEWLVIDNYCKTYNINMSEAEQIAINIYNTTGRTHSELLSSIIEGLERIHERSEV